MKRSSKTLAAAAVTVLGITAVALPTAQASDRSAKPSVAAAQYSYISSDLNPRQVLDNGKGFALSWSLHNGINQQWTLANRTAETVGIESRMGGCATATAPHGPVTIAPCDPLNLNQRWHKYESGDGAVTFVSALHPGQCLTKAGDFAPTVLSDCNYSTAQRWHLIPVS
ncbi:RICIN domain-containing protein [Streptomyces pathocidini]|uniref:RICIN domain-containing protein n=1 Tax=Streptomyces pathocidini TaxID=1650571 RepID=UPI0033E2597C